MRQDWFGRGAHQEKISAHRSSEGGGQNDTGKLNGNLADVLKPQESELGAIEIPELKLPKGGGALRGIDEKFAVNPSNGTASLTIGLGLTPNRDAFTPKLALSYSSGSGNGPFGLGWALDLSAIQRQTDRGIPRYLDDDDGSDGDADVFVLSGAEDLVPVLEEIAPGDWRPADQTSGGIRVRAYRPRVSGDLSRIERINHPAHGEYWKITDRANVVTIYGRHPAGRIADPRDPRKVFRWLPEFSFDNKGNWIRFEYKAEDLAAVPDTPGEAHRRSAIAPFANAYLKRVCYGNHTPYFADPADPYDPALPGGADTYHFEVVLDYGEHDAAAPLPLETPGRVWDYRPDAFSSCRAGFEIRTARLCRRVLMFHHFPDEDLGADCLVRAVDLTYAPGELGGAPQDQLVRLIAIGQAGYVRRGDGSYSRRALPPLEFAYQGVEWDRTVHTLPADAIPDAPVGALPPFRLVDLYGEGLPGILGEIGGAWFYKHGRGADPQTGLARYEAARLISPKPALKGLAGGALTLEDLDADGARQIVVNGPQGAGWFELDTDRAWEGFRPFDGYPNVDLRDPALRRIDLTGDGGLEIVVAEDDAFVWYRARGRDGFGPAERALRALDEERGPAVVFSEEQQTIFLADMTGDGLTDIVRVRNGEIVYWPNHGYGRFGARVTMANAPRFDAPDRYDPARIRLADVTGTGASDILYLGGDTVRAWLNQAGNGWSDAVAIGGFAPHAAGETIEVIDILGNGTPCLVWSSYLPDASPAPLRYVDLMGGRKPHLLVRYVNNLGKETRLAYRSSTRDFLADRDAGAAWITRLPFPVQVVGEQAIEDKVTGMRLVTRFTYHHGYWDPVEREFRGFGRVDRIDVEDFAAPAPAVADDPRELHQPPTLTRTWYHVGAFHRHETFMRQFEAEYWQPRYAAAFPAAPPLPPEPTLPEGRLDPASTIADPRAIARLSPAERREAARACKSLVLRQEVFALDAPVAGASEAELMLQATPFTVAAHGCHVQLLQPRSANAHAVFMVVEDQTFKLHYQRRPADPRIQHSINLAIDEQGNVLDKAEIVYGRDPLASAAAADALRDAASDFAGVDDAARVRQALDDALTRAEATQTRDWVTFVRSVFTNDVARPDCWRTRLPAEVSTYEIAGLARAGTLFTVAELANVLDDATSQEIGFADPAPAGISRRPIERQQTVYYDEDALQPLPLGVLASHGLAFQGRTLAYADNLLTQLYGTRIADPATTLAAGGHVSPDGGASWWIPSGTVRYADPGETRADVRARFFKALAHIDPFGAETRVGYHKDYFLLLEWTRDAAGNRTRIERFDFRLLCAAVLRDANDNLSGIVSDELGLVKALALFGKDVDGDGTAELELADTLAGISADGTAEAGDIAALLAATDALDIDARGRALLNQATFRFVYDLDAWRLRAAPAVAISITRERHHAIDPAPRLHFTYDYTDGSGALAMAKTQAEPGMARQAVVQPDGSTLVSDVDTAALTPPRRRWVGTGRQVLNNKGRVVRIYEPYFSVTPAYETLPELVAAGISTVHTYDFADRLVRTDLPDGTFMRAEYDAWQTISWDPGDTVLQSRWHHERVARLIDARLLARGCDPVREQDAAVQSSGYANTPSRSLVDALGRPILAIEHAGIGADGKALFHATAIVRDIEGNVLAVHDARGNRPAAWAYDMAGRRAVETMMDAGTRWTLPTVSGKPLLAWDARGHIFEFAYDAMQRPLSTRVRGGDGPAPLDHMIMRARYGEGVTDDRARGLRGRMFRRWDTGGLEEWARYDAKGNLTETARRFASDYRTLVDWSGDLETPLEGERHVTTFSHDAVNRLVAAVHPDGSRVERRYNEANLLEAVSAALPGQSAVPIVSDMIYDAEGRRLSLRHGNGTRVDFRYDPDSRRLIAIHAVRSDGMVAQDLRYTHDAAGNLTHLEDKAIPALFFGNSMIEAVSRFAYDPLYRLTRAEGREHAGQQGSFGPLDNWDDAAFRVRHQPGDTMAWRPYTQTYRHDATGNLRELRHVAGTGSYTRAYAYEAATNRLMTTMVGSQVYAYDHHPAHGFLRSMPHLPGMRHDPRDRLIATARQQVATGTPETTYYVYDEAGTRIRKVTDRAAAAGAAPDRKDERLYLGALELYRSHAGATAGLERTSLHIMDGDRRAAMIERRNGIDDNTPALVFRYQLSNHIGSAVLEIDESGRTLGYEEYHPFGTTAYQATSASLPVAAARYRYSGMERDDESGLSCHGARYYIPWLGRWNKPDPAGLADGINPYQYVSGNPVRLTDPGGCNGWDRFWGGVKMVGGALETAAGGALVAAGAATAEFGVGVVIMGAGIAVVAHGADVTVSGARTMWNGEQVDTFTSQGMQAVGVERDTANLVDAGFSVVGSLGAGAVTRAPTVAGAIAGNADEAVTAGSTAVRAGAATDEAASVTLAFTPGLPTGHNIVGVTQGGATRWSHLVVDELATSGGSFQYVPKGTGASVEAWSRAAAPSGYLTTTVPVTSQGAAAATRLINASEGAAGTYGYLGNSCTTYATSILREAGVTAPSTTPLGTFLITAVQSPTVVTPIAVGGVTLTAGAATAQTLSSSEANTSLMEEPVNYSSMDEPATSSAPSAPATSSMSDGDAGMSSSESYGTCEGEPYYDDVEQVCYAY